MAAAYGFQTYLVAPLGIPPKSSILLDLTAFTSLKRLSLGTLKNIGFLNEKGLSTMND